LMLGGAYLCFEGAEKEWHAINTTDHAAQDLLAVKMTNAQLEESKVSGAVKTDFILSGEIMTITLASLPAELSLWMTAAVLAVAALIITAAVYGAVALIVKADDLGLLMAASGRLGATRAVGRGIVRGMPGFLALLVLVGTAAMIWVGGSIIVNGLQELGVHGPSAFIDDLAVRAAAMVSAAPGAVHWVVTAALDGVVGLTLGLLLIPLVTFVLLPIAGAFRRT